MKKIKLVIAIFLANIHLFAQSPDKLSYQAVIRDASNSLLVNTTIGMQISILQGTFTGNPVYLETHQAITNANGLISIEIGGGSNVLGNFSSIDWGNGPYFIKTETDPTGGTNYTISGTSQLLSVPYALYSKHSFKTSDSTLWSIQGNSKIGNSAFIGTTDAYNLNFRVNNTRAGFIDYKNNNTAFGYNSLKSPNSGSNNVSIGVNNLLMDSSGSDNIGIGNNTLSSNISGSGNIAIGSYSLFSAIDAIGNIGIGANTLRFNKLGNGSLAIGNNVLTNFDFPVWIAAYNTAVGEGSMYNVTIGYRNNGFGAYSLYHLTTGQQNTAIGIDAGQFLKTGNHNVF